MVSLQLLILVYAAPAGPRAAESSHAYTLSKLM